MRVGGAQDLLALGASLPQIMVKGGWVKPDTVMRYVERVRGYLYINICAQALMRYPILHQHLDKGHPQDVNVKP